MSLTNVLTFTFTCICTTPHPHSTAHNIRTHTLIQLTHTNEICIHIPYIYTYLFTHSSLPPMHTHLLRHIHERNLSHTHTHSQKLPINNFRRKIVVDTIFPCLPRPLPPYPSSPFSPSSPHSCLSVYHLFHFSFIQTTCPFIQVCALMFINPLG